MDDGDGCAVGHDFFFDLFEFGVFCVVALDFLPGFEHPVVLFTVLVPLLDECLVVAYAVYEVCVCVVGLGCVVGGLAEDFEDECAVEDYALSLPE